MMVYAPPKCLDLHISSLIEIIPSHINMDTPAIILGVFNFHIDSTPQSLTCKLLLETMSAIGFKQIVNTPMQKSGHTLDLMFINNKTSRTNNPLTTTDIPWSDHKLIHITLQLNINHTETSYNKKYIKFPKPCPSQDITEALPSALKDLNLNIADTATNSWLTINAEIAKSKCPIITKEIKTGNSLKVPWYKHKLKNIKRTLQQAEKKWRKDPTPTHLDKYRTILHIYKSNIDHSKREYYAKKIHDHQYNPRVLFNFVTKLTQPIQTPPSNENTSITCDILAQFLRI
ncbi:protein ABHD11 isoform X3 [Rhinatrema bivittatum]|nr:protein ABHD11 isoform X3 [Rhinatrema bivittatum]XP_029468886.1 protein ABHD11 isoform X3 [Rhinatrema bivittatum]XP_029468887.1 protein ABHD11 isoform X3 [Rhinatrema bivittatum]